MRVIHIPTGQEGDIPDNKYDPNLFKPVQPAATATAPSSVEQQARAQMVQQPVQKSFGGLASNAMRDAGDFARGLWELPGNIAQGVKALSNDPEYIKNTQGTGGLGTLIGAARTPSVQKAAGQVVGGIVNDYKELLSNPVDTAYNKPVSTLMNVLPFLKVGKAGKATQLAKKGDTAEKVASGAVSAEQAAARTSGAKELLKNFTIAKTKDNSYLNKVKQAHAEEIIQHPIPTNMKQMGEYAKRITGDKGVLSKVVRDAHANLKVEVPTDQVYSTLDNALLEGATLTEAEAAKIARTIRKTLKPGGLPNTTNALDAFDTQKKLEKLAAQYARNTDVKSQEIANVYRQTAAEIGATVEQVGNSQAVVETIKTPKLMAELEKISPRLAQQVREAKTIQELRSVQAPWVSLNKMVDITTGADRTPSQQILENMGNGGMVGVVKDAANLIDPTLSEKIGDTISSARIKNAQNIAQGNSVTQGIKNVGGGVKTTLGNLPLAGMVSRNVPVNNQQGQPQQQPTPANTNGGNGTQNMEQDGLHTNSLTLANGNTPVSTDQANLDRFNAAHGVGGMSQDQLSKALIADAIATGGKNADIINMIYKSKQPKLNSFSGANDEELLRQYEAAISSGDTERAKMISDYVTTKQKLNPAAKAKSSQAIKDETKAKTALNAVTRLENKLSSNPEALFNRMNPLDQTGRQLDADIKSAIDIIGYFRTGATLTPDQRKDYIDIFPSPLDDAETKAYKIKSLKEELSGYLGSTSGDYGNEQQGVNMGGLSFSQ